MKNNSNPKMKYRVVTGRHPRTGEIAYRPVIAERETVNIEDVVQYALENGYVIGHPMQICFTVTAITEAIRSLIREGKVVNLCGLLRVRGELTGTVDVSGKLTKENDFRTVASPLKSAKCGIEDFNWEKI